MLGSDQFLDLAAEQPRPRIPMRLGGPVLELARVDRRVDLVLGYWACPGNRAGARHKAVTNHVNVSLMSLSRAPSCLEAKHLKWIATKLY